MYPDLFDNQLHNEIVAMSTNPIKKIIHEYRFNSLNKKRIIPLVVAGVDHYQVNSLDDCMNTNTQV